MKKYNIRFRGPWSEFWVRIDLLPYFQFSRLRWKEEYNHPWVESTPYIAIYWLGFNLYIGETVEFALQKIKDKYGYKD
jgi:hypothetical protein